MASKKKKFGKKREFLNPQNGVAAASYLVEVTHNIDKKGKWPTLDMDSDIQLSDCDRKISLEFGVWVEETDKGTLKAIQHRRAKLKRLQDVINEFADATNKAYDFIEANLDEYQTARKAYEAAQKKKKKK